MFSFVQDLKAACLLSSKCSKSFVFDGKVNAQVLHFNPTSFYCSAFFIFFNFALPIVFSSSASSYSDSELNSLLFFFTVGFFCWGFPFPFAFLFLVSSGCTTWSAFFVLFLAKDTKISSYSDESSEVYFLGFLFFFRFLIPSYVASGSYLFYYCYFTA